jgi:hypothetical protein
VTGAPSAAAAAVKPPAPPHPRRRAASSLDRGVANEATALCHNPDSNLNALGASRDSQIRAGNLKKPAGREIARSTNRRAMMIAVGLVTFNFGTYGAIKAIEGRLGSISY